MVSWKSHDRSTTRVSDFLTLISRLKVLIGSINRFFLIITERLTYICTYSISSFHFYDLLAAALYMLRHIYGHQMNIQQSPPQTGVASSRFACESLKESTDLVSSLMAQPSFNLNRGQISHNDRPHLWVWGRHFNLRWLKVLSDGDVRYMNMNVTSFRHDQVWFHHRRCHIHLFIEPRGITT